MSWFDWTLLDKHADLQRFVSLLCARRVLRSAEQEEHRVNLSAILRDAKLTWHGVKLNQPDWSDGSHAVALGSELTEEGLLFHFIFNAFWQPLSFELPALNGDNSWRRWIDTSLDSPDDIVTWETAMPVPGNTYQVADRSVVMLLAHRAK
jgi:glycogen operon protein